MKHFFRFIASTTGRWLRGTLGFAMIAWGYNYNGPHAHIPLILLGCIPFFTALFDLCPLAPLFGYPLQGKDITARYGEVGTPGEV